MKVLSLSHHADVRMALLLARHCGLSAANDAVDQLVDRLGQFRREREEQIAALKAELEALAELRRTKAELEVLRLLNRWPEQCATRQ
jgi:hypothetical protein